ncbi:hypothetical protein N7520_009158 [Penicillium odoratum]|uniref:uncharacterized protein n=1 Tax=Penicillium odoratum TaxID=1167516 RepID=UPI0025478D41|nr:uncharacterized protein N7520_009158 [Penicillium odoratum]KAJ5752241.1 hypothetical protein N7520_009158 [Penicillium odoratum]
MWQVNMISPNLPCHQRVVAVSGDELKARFSTYKALVADNSSLLVSETFSMHLRGCLEKSTTLTPLDLRIIQRAFYLTHDKKEYDSLAGAALSIKSISDSGLRTSNRFMVAEASWPRLLQALSGASRLVALITVVILAQKYFSQMRNTASSLQSNLNHLEDLHVCTAFRTPNPTHILDTPTWVTTLIHVAPRLETLTISQDYYVGELPRKLQFNHLKELHIHKISINSEDLKIISHESQGNPHCFHAI